MIDQQIASPFDIAPTSYIHVAFYGEKPTTSNKDEKGCPFSPIKVASSLTFEE